MTLFSGIEREAVGGRDPGISAEEWQARIDLAACYRIVSHYGMTDMIFNHISLRVPGEDGHFLLNPFGFFYDEVTASNLVKVDADGQIVSKTEHGINPAGFVIHSAVHQSRHDVACVIHTHTRAGVAVSAQKAGLLPLSQHAMRFFNRVAYHDYEGVALDLDERDRLIADLGQKNVIFLRNHGVLVCGPTVRSAFELLYYLEMACKIQVDCLSSGQELVIPSDEVAERTAHQYESVSDNIMQNKDWIAILRLLDSTSPNFRH